MHTSWGRSSPNQQMLNVWFLAIVWRLFSSNEHRLHFSRDSWRCPSLSVYSLQHLQFLYTSTIAFISDNGGLVFLGTPMHIVTLLEPMLDSFGWCFPKRILNIRYYLGACCLIMLQWGCIDACIQTKHIKTVKHICMLRTRDPQKDPYFDIWLLTPERQRIQHQKLDCYCLRILIGEKKTSSRHLTNSVLCI